MANKLGCVQNLISLADRPPDELKRITSAGGIRSGQVRRYNAILRIKLQLMLDPKVGALMLRQRGFTKKEAEQIQARFGEQNKTAKKVRFRKF